MKVIIKYYYIANPLERIFVWLIGFGPYEAFGLNQKLTKHFTARTSKGLIRKVNRHYARKEKRLNRKDRKLEVERIRSSTSTIEI